jgi:hypothetical protein
LSQLEGRIGDTIMSGLPLSDAKQFHYESRGRIWCGYPFEQTNQGKDKKQLNGAQPSKYIGVGRATGECVGAFHMTRCKERQARGKGLACHFLPIVPTCL